MFLFYIFVFLIHGVFSITPCSDGERIISQETNNPEDLLGNWTYVYHWDKIKYPKEFLENEDHMVECPQLNFKAIDPALIRAKEAQCAAFKAPFNWADAKLSVDAPALEMKDAVIIYGEKENWMTVDCSTMVRVVLKKVADDYIAMINPDDDAQYELIARQTPTLEELKCVAHNVDVGKGKSGFGICYKK